MVVRHSGQLRTCRGTPLYALWLRRLNATAIVRTRISASCRHLRLSQIFAGTFDLYEHGVD